VRADEVSLRPPRPTSVSMSRPPSLSMNRSPNPNRPASLGGSRLLRGDQVDLNRPRPLSVPQPVGAGEQPAEPSVPGSPPPPSFDELAEAARSDGYRGGYEEGYAAGLAAAEQATADSIHRLSRLVAGAIESHAGFFRAAEREVVDLALQIAHKVVEREVENMPDLAVNIIRAALEEMDARTAVRVRVSPADEELVRRRWTQVVPPGIGPDRIELQADERIQAGGAVIETTQGQVDAQLETKLAQLGNALWTFVAEASSASEPTDA
jgi:flagellar assembly protein FliH